MINKIKGWYKGVMFKRSAWCKSITAICDAVNKVYINDKDVAAGIQQKVREAGLVLIEEYHDTTKVNPKMVYDLTAHHGLAVMIPSFRNPQVLVLCFFRDAEHKKGAFRIKEAYIPLSDKVTQEKLNFILEPA